MDVGQPGQQLPKHHANLTSGQVGTKTEVGARTAEPHMRVGIPGHVELFGVVEHRLIPDIRSRIVTKFHYAPRDFALDLNAHMGSAFSLEPVLTQSAYFRGHNRDDVLDNFYLVGAGTHPGAGIPGVVGSAKATAGLMLEDMAV